MFSKPIWNQTMRIRVTPLAFALSTALGFTVQPAHAQISRNPTGVNVNAQGATTVFLTFGNLEGYVPDEAIWCGELISAAPDIGNRCNPATIFGSLPLRFDLSTTSGDDGFTDIMSIPPSVARRAYQAAVDGASSEFFYVRRFIDPTGAGPDQYVTVTCRLSGGGARVPFSLLDVQVDFASQDEVLVVDAEQELPPLSAKIVYNGTGRLVGRWEVVFPGEEPPTAEDLLTEATLPEELRGTQKLYTELSRFNVFLPPVGEYTLEGPPIEVIPNSLEGFYQILLRIEASDDKEGDSSLDAAGAGEGLVHTGAVAGFPMPILRYFVGNALAVVRPDPETGFGLLEPMINTVLARDRNLVFSWLEHTTATLYRLEVATIGREPVLSALVERGTTSYSAPGWLADRVGDGGLLWRVVALDGTGLVIGLTDWRGHRWQAPN